MTGTAIKFARNDAINTLRLSFPYEGPTRGRVTVRDRDGLDVYLQVSQGQILCMDTDGWSVLVKFDDHPAETYGATGASDHDPTYIFLDDPASFIEKARSAKRIMVRFEMYQAGEQTLTFSTPKPLVFEAAEKK